jgi:hypothetical protein
METERHEHDNTRGIAIGGLVTGITSLGTQLLNGSLGNFFGGMGCGNCAGQPTIYTLQEKECADNLELTKALYENRLRDISELNAFREKDVNEKFNLYTTLMNRITRLETNEAVMAAVEPYRSKLIYDKIDLEAERRCCADNKIVEYLNGNFQPLYVADMTPATTSVERATYNPLCGCCGTRKY